MRAAKNLSVLCRRGHFDWRTLLSNCLMVVFGLALVSPGWCQSADFLKTKALAEKGDAAAQNKLGELCAADALQPFEYVEAARWYRKAAEQGLAAAQLNLSWCYGT